MPKLNVSLSIFYNSWILHVVPDDTTNYLINEIRKTIKYSRQPCDLIFPHSAVKCKCRKNSNFHTFLAQMVCKKFQLNEIKESTINRNIKKTKNPTNLF